MPIHSPLLDPRASREQPSAERPSVFAGTVSRIDAGGQVFAKVPRVDPVGAVLLRGVDGSEVAAGDAIWVAFSDKREALAVSLGGGRFVPVTTTQGGTAETPEREYVWTLYTPDEDRGPFRQVIGGAEFSDVFNPVMYLGYNTRGELGREDTTEPLAQYVIETDYDDGASRDVEIYCEFVSEDASVIMRPFFFKIQRDGTNPDTIMHAAGVVGNPFVIQAPAVTHGAQPTIASFEKFLARVLGFSTADTILRVEGGTGHVGILNLGRNGTNDYMALGPNAGAAEYGTLSLNGRTILHLFSAPNGAAGQSLAIGAQDNSAVGFFAVGTSDASVKGIVAKGRAGQSGNLFEAQDSSGAVVASVSPAGALASTPAGWTAPSLLNSWVNYGGSEDTAGYRKQADGMIYLKGLVKSGTVNTPVFTLPAGYRPLASKIFAVNAGGAFGHLHVATNGDVILDTGSNTYVSLASVFFPTT